MKNTRTQRSSSDQKEYPRFHWIGLHKYWNKFGKKKNSETKDD